LALLNDFWGWVDQGAAAYVDSLAGGRMKFRLFALYLEALFQQESQWGEILKLGVGQV
jgi:hypothetical protein